AASGARPDSRGGARAGQRGRGAHPRGAAGDRRRCGAHRAVKLCMFSPTGHHLLRGWPGRIEGDRIIQLAAQTLQSFFTGGGHAREHAEHRLDEVELLTPVLHPPSVRDFYTFEQHVKAARARRGLDVPEEWYRIPVFYFSNPAVIYGPEVEIPYPEGTQELDYELEVAAIRGDEGGARTVEGQGLRNEPGPDRRHARRVRRLRRHDDRARERRGAFARRPRGHVPLVGQDRRACRSQHRALARRRARLGDGRYRLHPRARRRPGASAWRRRRARGGGNGGAADAH